MIGYLNNSQLDVPVALVTEKQPIVHILDLGKFSADGDSFETDFPLLKFLYEGVLIW